MLRMLFTLAALMVANNLLQAQDCPGGTCQRPRSSGETITWAPATNLATVRMAMPVQAAAPQPMPMVAAPVVRVRATQSQCQERAERTGPIREALGRPAFSGRGCRCR